MSATLSSRLDPRVLKALEDTGLPFSLEAGARHIKMRLQGYMVGIFPTGKHKDSGAGDKKLASQIKRAARAISEGRNPCSRMG